MAPGYACLGMGLVEDKLWKSCPLKPSEWCRYIGDIWGLWPHGNEAFISFVGILNNLYPDELEYTYEFDFNTINFLDIRIQRSKEGFLSTGLFVKPTFKNLYLRYDSYHSMSTLDNIAYGQALRIKSFCSDERDVHRNLTDLHNNLSERSYPSSKSAIWDSEKERLVLIQLANEYTSTYISQGVELYGFVVYGLKHIRIG
ncbi:hypothetical protein HOLleu_05652 [Holothuria leucospilota]|uniref:Helix-turn-helix domain-containing protein n=1 Tax=Holothuria leucospilota TaxID=206669 RepID=A0A9Q1HEP0_HOLLE|nr:hypothetical protein HOLleu_05652 [Holothuria leucospilota]